MKSKNTLPLLGCVAVLLVGCAAISRPGEEPGPIPPRIVDGKDGKIWDNPTAFGRVPADRQREGDLVCQKNDFNHASGFHPKAFDFYGNQIKRGGFFCVGKRDKGNNPPSGS